MRNKKMACLMMMCAGLLITNVSDAQRENYENNRLVERWFEHIADHDTLGLAMMYADTAIIESPNWEGTKKGPAAIREIYSRYFTTSPDLTHRQVNIFTNDKTIVIEYIFSGTMVDPEKGSPAYMRGKKYTLKACSRMNIENGKIAAQSYYFDQVAFLRQVGFFDQK